MHFKSVLIIALLSVPGAGVAQEPTILEYGRAVYALAYSPVDSSIIAAAGIADNREDCIIKVWNLGANKTITFQGHTDTVNAVAFSPSGRLLASGSDDGTFRLWEVIQRQKKPVIKQHLVNGLPKEVKAVAFSPDGRLLVTAGEHVKVWSARTLQERVTFRHSRPVWALAFSPDGRYLAAGEGGNGGPGRVKVWDLPKRKLAASLEADVSAATSVVFSSDNQTLASGGRRGQIKLWRVSDWQLRGTLHRVGEVAALDFAPDSKTLAAGGRDILSLWSAENGRVIVFLPGHSGVGMVRATAFSNDGVRLASGSDDGMVRIQNIEKHLQPAEQRPMVRLIYLVPRDRAPQKNITTKIDTVIRDVQRFYAEQMEYYGHGRKSFVFETDAVGKALVRQVAGRSDDEYYHEDTWLKVGQEIGWLKLGREIRTLDHTQIDVVVVDMSQLVDHKFCGRGKFAWDGNGRVIVPADCLNMGVTAHELGHAFGLEHDFRNGNHIMSYGFKQPLRLSKCAAEWLNAHPFFNDNQAGFNEPMTIEMLTPLANPPHGVIFNFKIDDADGLRQSMLLGATVEGDPAGGIKLYDCESLSAESEIVEFVIPKSLAYAGDDVTLRVIDAQGDFWQKEFSVEAVHILRADVNEDGRISVADVTSAAAFLGRSDPRAVLKADVNGDGVVDVTDLVLVVSALENANGAPAANEGSLAVDLQRWLAEAMRNNSTDQIHQQGIRALEPLLEGRRPTETALLPNYPNPFNPETWMPYHLARDADVDIAIYDARGVLVRRLELDWQAAGFYIDRAHAAYWDGRNNSGESVANGVYFYQLRAGDYAQVRQMAVIK